MLRTLKKILPLSGQHIQRCRRHQFVPSVTGSAANLEERTMLSGAGGAAVAHAAIDHAALHRNAAHHAMTRHAALHHHTQVHHAMARHAAVHHARFHAAAARPAIQSEEHRVEAQRMAFAAATGAAAPHDPVITAANADGITTGLSSSSNFVGAGLTAGTFNGLTTIPGTLPAGLQNTFQVTNGLGVAQPAVVAQFPLSSTMTRVFNISPTATLTNGNAALNAINTSAMASALESLLGGTGTGTALAGTSNTALASELASLLGSTGTTTLGTGTGTLAESPLAALLLGGQVPTAGLPTTTGRAETLASLINTLSPLRRPVNPSPLPFNGSLLFTRTPVNPSPLPFNGSLPFTRSPINPSPLPFNGVLM